MNTQAIRRGEGCPLLMAALAGDALMVELLLRGIVIEERFDGSILLKECGGTISWVLLPSLPLGLPPEIAT